MVVEQLHRSDEQEALAANGSPPEPRTGPPLTTPPPRGHDALLEALDGEHARAAERDYAAAARAFDALAWTLLRAAAVVDLRTPAGDLLRRSADERTAWLTAQRTARRLDEQAALLAAAARAAGRWLGDPSHRSDLETEQWLQLTVDTRGWDRHLVWAAWDAVAPNAADRWGAMLLAGFDLRAAPLADIRPVHRPPPVDRGRSEPPAEDYRPMPWLRAIALIVTGVLALGVALTCAAFAAAFFVAAVIEPRDVLLAAREALVGVVLLGGGVSAGTTWALLAAVTEARSAAPRRRRTSTRRFARVVALVAGRPRPPLPRPAVSARP